MVAKSEMGAVAEVTVVDDGHVRVRGPLSFASVPALATRPAPWLRTGASIEVDLSGVTHADSAGLAMVLDWLSQASAAGASLLLRGAPAQMLAIARVSGLVALFEKDAAG